MELRNQNCVRKKYGRDSQMLPNDKSKTYSDKLYWTYIQKVMHLPLKDLIEKKKKVNAINCLIVNYGCKLKKYGMSNV